jgi:hypothetical protein
MSSSATPAIPSLPEKFLSQQMLLCRLKFQNREQVSAIIALFLERSYIMKEYFPSKPARLVSPCVVLALFLTALPTLAGGGNVLPSSAKTKGYSLVDAAAATAVFNTGPHDTAAPSLPFYTLTDDATVKPGTTLYIPIYYADDSGEVVPPFPEDITDQDADADYLDGLVADAFGVQAFIIVVDGKVTVLDDSYISGTATDAPLQDGPPAGTHYIVSAAYLTPLTPGKHTIGIGGIIEGHAVVFVSYSVSVSH